MTQPRGNPGRAARLAAAGLAISWLVLAHPAGGAFVRVVAAGDIACDPGHPAFNGGVGIPTHCRQRATSDLALSLQPQAALLLGDLQYDDGTFAKFQASFDPSWGRLGPLLHPAPGNHDYATPGGSGYHQYFGGRAAEPGKGWYSFALPGWHLIALNSNCGAVGGCAVGSPQHAWLRADLAANDRACTLAYWHHPRFSSGVHGSDEAFRPFWRALEDETADLVLVAHDHNYERFAPQDSNGGADRTGGLRQIVVGTGGHSQRVFSPPVPNSESRITGVFGVLALDLYPNGYLWRFIGSDNQVRDAGGSLCHRAWHGEVPDFHPLPGCRVVSTRRGDGPALREPRDFRLAGKCGIPADAVAVKARITTLASTARGRLAVYPAGEPSAEQPALGFLRGRVVSTDLLLPLGHDGAITLAPTLLLPRASVHVIVDVSGYFR